MTVPRTMPEHYYCEKDLTGNVYPRRSLCNGKIRKIARSDASQSSSQRAGIASRRGAVARARAEARPLRLLRAPEGDEGGALPFHDAWRRDDLRARDLVRFHAAGAA